MNQRDFQTWLIAKTHSAHVYVICSPCMVEILFLFVTPWAILVLHALDEVYALKICVAYCLHLHFMFKIFSVSVR